MVLIAPIINQGLSTYSLSLVKGNQVNDGIALLFGAIQSLVFVIGFIPIFLKWFPNILNFKNASIEYKKNNKKKIDFDFDLFFNPKNDEEKYFRNKVLIITSGILIIIGSSIWNIWQVGLLILFYLIYLYFDQNKDQIENNDQLKTKTYCQFCSNRGCIACKRSR